MTFPMNIESLLPDTSRNTADEAATFIMPHPDYLEQMIQLSFSDKKLMAMRASRVILLIYYQQPELLKPHLDFMIDQLCESGNGSTIRNYLNLFRHETENLDEFRLGKLVNLSFNLLESPSSEIAHRSLAMEVLYKVSIKIPDFKDELKALIELHYEEGTPAFKSTANKILKKLNKEIF